MTTISGASALSMSSLYALMGQAMPSGVSTASADGAASNPALAMEAAANASAGMEVLTQESHWVGGTEHSESYLAAKKSKLGHLS